MSVIGHPFTESRLSLFELLADSTVCLMLSVHDGFGLTGWERSRRRCRSSCR